MLRALARAVVPAARSALPSRSPLATPLASPLASPLLQRPMGPCPASGLLSSLFSLQVRGRLSGNNYGQRKSKPGRPHAGKKHGTWWQPLLPALAAERCAYIAGKGSNKRKINQQRRQQSVWDIAKRKESKRRRAIFTTLKKDATRERVHQVYAEYAEFLRQHPNGCLLYTSPSPRDS